MKTYDQKAAVYWSVIKANPKISANAIGRRYAGTPNKMRKEDRNELVRSLKDAVEYKNLINKSDIHPEAKARMTAKAFRGARQSTQKGHKIHPTKRGFPRRTMRQTIIDTFGIDTKPDDNIEFYNESFDTGHENLDQYIDQLQF